MQWLQNADTGLFRFINVDLANPFFDQVMPWISGNQFFYPALIVLGLLLIWKGGLRGFICVALLALIVSLGDGLVLRTIKEAVGRPRPFLEIAEARCLIGKGGSGSLPSAHAANWAAATVIAFIYFRRSWWFTLPLALLVGFSRVYNGVHYPGDVLVGMILGAGYAAGGVWSLDALWNWAGRKWFPLWHKKLPSLMNPPRRLASEEEEEPVVPPRHGRDAIPAPQVSLDQHWLRLGYILILLLLVGRWFYIGSDTIQLSEDEAYQWIWSKNLDWSYYSKPPLIAWAQLIGTSLWGDTASGVRFLSPLISSILGLLILRFFAREVNARAGFFLLLILTATPLLGVGSVLMTVDPLSVLFWTAAMLSGWYAVQEKGGTSLWLWTGLWMGLGFLSKYTALFQLLCWAVFFALWPPARKHLRRPGPYLALLIVILCSLPVLYWNAQRDWITVTHLAQGAGAGKTWHPTLKFLLEFLVSEFGLLNPVFFTAAVWASFAMWRRGRQNPRLVYFFSMGAPLFLAYTLQSFRDRILPNWIAPAVVPLFFVMVIYWDTRWRLGQARVKAWYVAGLAVGLPIVLVLHDTNLVGKFIGKPLPIALDPLHRVREWDQLAQQIGEAREDLLAEGKPVFIIANHYGLVGQTSFYLPEARERVTDRPLVFYETSPFPVNQFYFLPGYGDRKGENAVYVRELDRRKPEPEPPPAELLTEFECVSEAGQRYVLYHGCVLRVLQVFYCRGLR